MSAIRDNIHIYESGLHALFFSSTTAKLAMKRGREGVLLFRELDREGVFFGEPMEKFPLFESPNGYKYLHSGGHYCQHRTLLTLIHARRSLLHWVCKANNI